ncbi:MAG: flavodoxin family protein [Candidatus Saliniplasma sp.]
MKSLIICKSIHHGNTKKVADRMAKVLDSEVVEPEEVDLDEIGEYDILGFGSGIYSGKHHETLYALVDKLPKVENKKVFIFSTCGTPEMVLREEYFRKTHSRLKEKLQSKGYTVVDEFGCIGLNTNSFLKLFGGINKGRPEEDDLKRAEEFVKDLRDGLVNR